MALFKKKSDPIAERSRTLQAEISALEAEIQQLHIKANRSSAQPRLRSTARADGHTISLATASGSLAPNGNPEPIFESMDHRNVAAPDETATTPAYYNELGVRKYDMAAAWLRFRNHFRGPAASNPKLVSYLAAGSIRGLRPLRYEKRVARNRFLGSCLILLLALWGVIHVFIRNH